MAFGNRGSDEPQNTPAEVDRASDDSRDDGVPDHLGTRAEARPVSEASDGGEPSIRKEIRDLPDDEKPDPSTIAQEEVLHEPEPEGDGDEE